MKYLRIVTEETLPISDAREGFFRAAYNLRRNGALPPAALAQLDACLDYLDDHIDAPETFTKSRAKGAAMRETKGISWFKSEAHHVIDRAMELSRLLDDLGIRTEVLRTSRVGYITYEDAVQVVAEPFSDTPR